MAPVWREEGLMPQGACFFLQNGLDLTYLNVPAPQSAGCVRRIVLPNPAPQKAGRFLFANHCL
jgi:hypothetical protein